MKRRRWSLRRWMMVAAAAVVGYQTGGLVFERAASAEEKPVVVIMDTSFGEVEIELNAEKAPKTVANFLQYVDDKFYDGVIFHRVISDFMIQGGGMTPGMKEKKTREQIKNEADNGLKNTRGTIAMARTGVVDSATAQFFINVKNNDSLNHRDKTSRGYGYCVFGKVVKGMEVVDDIRGLKTHSAGGHDDVPVDDVVIKSIRRKKSKDEAGAAKKEK